MVDVFHLGFICLFRDKCRGIFLVCKSTAVGLCTFLLYRKMIPTQTLVGSNIPYWLSGSYTWIAACCTHTHAHVVLRADPFIFVFHPHFGHFLSSLPTLWQRSIRAAAATVLPSTAINKLVKEMSSW